MGSRALSTALSLSVLAALAPGLLGASKPVDLSGMTAGKWREDLDYFARELPRRHKNAFHTTPRERFEQEVASLKARADTAHADEMLVGIMKITALVGDGHTGIRLPDATPFMPITVVTIEGAQRVVRAAGAAAPLVGGRLIRIDDTPLDEAVARIRTILASAESEVLTAAFTPFWLSVPAALHGLGITKRAAAARYTVLLDDGTERGAEVSPLAPGIEPD